MTTLPDGAIGTVDVSTRGLNAPPGSKMQVLVFDDKGQILGSIDGRTITGPRIRTWNRGLAVGMGNALTSVTDSKKTDIPIDEIATLGGATNPTTGSALFWFNTGGHGQDYRSNYVTLNNGEHNRSGHVPGYMFSAAICGSNQMAIATPIEDFTLNGPDLRYQLYNLSGSSPSIPIDEWRVAMNMRPAIRSAACAADDKELIMLYKNADDAASNELLLSKRSIENGSHSDRPVDLKGHSSKIADGTVTVTSDRIYWVNGDQKILSLPISGPPVVRHEWTLPIGSGTDTAVTSATGTTLAYLQNPEVGDSMYREYEITTGKELRPEISLPWLNDMIDNTESGGVASVASIPS